MKNPRSAFTLHFSAFSDARHAVSCALLACVACFSLSAQAGYLPPNPITPPVVTPPVYAPESAVSPVVPPAVSAPEVSGVSVSPESGNGAARSSGAASAGKAAGVTGANSASGTPGAAGASGTAGTKVDATKTPNPGAVGKKALPKDLSSVSALTLLDLAGDNPLFGALTGSSAESGGIDALTKLLSGDTDEKGANGAASGALGASGSAALQKAIALMAREKADRESAAGNASSGNSGGAHTVTIPERVVSGGAIARFVVNGNDVAKSVSALVSSAIARDGSFLLTGDRTYPGGDRWLTETFYLLCRKTGPGTYALYADLSQAVPNANSFLYRLARMTPIEGRLEGDLITFESSARDWRLDLAIRVFSASVGGKTVR